MSLFYLVLVALFAPAWAIFNLDTSHGAVGVCYSVWHSLGYTGKSAPPDITEIEHGNGTFAAQGSWHWWGRPAGGYYQGGDRAVLSRHFNQIANAGIDFIAIDATNLIGYGNYHKGLFTEPTDVLLDEMYCQRKAHNSTPSVVFWVRTGATDPDPSAVGRFVHDRYYTNASYADFWVTYEGKPLLLTSATRPPQLAANFTMRKMWGLQGSLQESEWSFLQNVPQNVGKTDGIAEEVSVNAAKQAGYMSDMSSATPRKQGATLEAQWARAFAVRPKLVMLAWWNQWIAQRQINSAGGKPQFVDEFNSEYSNDLEPQDPTQDSGHGDRYLNWTASYIQAYKAGQTQPTGLTGYAPTIQSSPPRQGIGREGRVGRIGRIDQTPR